MKRSMIMVFGLLMGLLAIFSINQEPQPVSAGGWPCFLCHGGATVPGTDLAPTLAGTKLSDEQIIAQVRHPRGMMPAFSVSDFSDEQLKNGFIQPIIRAAPKGQPTATLSPENRSQALALIGGVALARATEYARLNSSASIDTPTPEPTPTRTVTPNTVVTESTFDWGMIAIAGGLLGIIVVGAWVGFKVMLR